MSAANVGAPFAAAAVVPLLALRWGMHQSALAGGLILSGVIMATARFALRERRRNTLFLRRRPSRRCPRCKGFGLIRCDMCDGEGIVRYEKKMSHVDLCPQCLLHRCSKCTMCGGSGERPMLNASSARNAASSRADVLAIAPLRRLRRWWRLRKMPQ